MLQNILKENGVTEINKNQQKSINGGFGSLGCADGISLDGTLCICRGWYPLNGVCVNGNQ